MNFVVQDLEKAIQCLVEIIICTASVGPKLLPRRREILRETLRFAYAK